MENKKSILKRTLEVEIYSRHYSLERENVLHPLGDDPIQQPAFFFRTSYYFPGSAV